MIKKAAVLLMSAVASASLALLLASFFWPIEQYVYGAAGPGAVKFPAVGLRCRDDKIALWWWSDTSSATRSFRESRWEEFAWIVIDERFPSPPTLVRLHQAEMPRWVLGVLCLLCLPYPAVFMRQRYRLYRRRKQGHCIQCNYNLTGNVSGICPECGERI